ncbi:hypothetical protein MKX01_014202 [Papaver californicum]|nr:hypothetical protein MKX01_014202 [Papaver californicum]
MEFTFQQSPRAPLFLNVPFLFPSSFFIPEDIHSLLLLIFFFECTCVRKEEIKVEVEDSNFLIIRTEEINEETKPAVSFIRKFKLPSMIDIGSILAGYEDRILTVTVPRNFARRHLHIDLSDLPDIHEILSPTA